MNAVSVITQNAVDRHDTLSGEISQLERFVTSRRHDPRRRPQLRTSPSAVASVHLANRVKSHACIDASSDPLEEFLSFACFRRTTGRQGVCCLALSDRLALRNGTPSLSCSRRLCLGLSFVDSTRTQHPMSLDRRGLGRQDQIRGTCKRVHALAQKSTSCEAHHRFSQQARRCPIAYLRRFCLFFPKMAASYVSEGLE